MFSSDGTLISASAAPHCGEGGDGGQDPKDIMSGEPTVGERYDLPFKDARKRHLRALENV